jgi:4-amino-4-deoxy-L-arabinose transferase-like glycosyltransferase
VTAVTAGRPVTLTRARAATARWDRIGLGLLLVATAALYLIGLSRNGWANDFYSAAVQAGSTSWKAFFFGSFDSSNFITVDKTPASLWVMELSARVFGLNYWSVLVPQALAGVASVGVLYAAVRRWSGPGAGLLAGAILACTPVAALMFRFNNPDALLVLLMTLAAYATVRAIESGRTRWIVLAGALLGMGFLTKMLQAFLVLPAFAVAYLVAGPPRLGRRIRQLLAGAAALIVAAGWWVAAVMLTPAADRPYIGGSTSNSVLQLALGYNGLGRLDGQETGSVGFSGGGRGGGGGGPSFSGSTGLGRLFAADMGGQISWLLPVALLALAVLIWVSWREPRTGRTRAAVLVWGGWLLVTGGVFSFMAGIIHPYYTVALAPAIAALTAIGATWAWRARDGWAGRVALAGGTAATALWSWKLLDRSPDWHPGLRLAVLITGLTAAVALLIWPWLAGPDRAAHGQIAPGPAGPGYYPPGPTGRPARWLAPSRLAAAPAAVALIAVLAGPVAYSLSTASTAHTGALPSAGPTATTGGPGGGFGGGGPGGFGGGTSHGTRPGSGTGSSASSGSAGFGGPPSGTGTGTGSTGTGGTGTGGPPGLPSGTTPGGGTGTSGSGSSTGNSPAGLGGRGTAGGMGGGAGGPGGLGGSTTVSQAVTTLLKDGASGYRWAAATVGSESAAPLELSARVPVMSIGGFNGTDAAPTLAAFQKLVKAHEIHYFVGTNADSFGGGSGTASQITTWVAAHYTKKTVGGLTVYDLNQPEGQS